MLVTTLLLVFVNSLINKLYNSYTQLIERMFDSVYSKKKSNKQYIICIPNTINFPQPNTASYINIKSE